MNILFFLFALPLGDESFYHFVEVIGVIPAELLGKTEGVGIIPEWLTPLISSLFHVDIFHLGFNLFFFWIFADNIEEAFGSRRFFVFCIAAALVSDYLYALTCPEITAPSIGFSAIVTASMGAYMALFPLARVHILVNPFATLVSSLNLNESIPAAGFILVFLSVDIALFLHQILNSVDVSSQAGVVYPAHFYGFAFGLLTAKFFRRNDTLYDLENSPTKDKR